MQMDASTKAKQLEIVTQDIVDNILFNLEKEILPKINAHMLREGDLEIIDANIYKNNNLDLMKQRISAAVQPILPILLDSANSQQGKDDFYQALKDDLTRIIIEIKNNKIQPPSTSPLVSSHAPPPNPHFTKLFGQDV